MTKIHIKMTVLIILTILFSISVFSLESQEIKIIAEGDKQPDCTSPNGSPTGCPSGKVCKNPPGKCVECVSQTNCAPNQQCIGNKCITETGGSCTIDKDCLSGKCSAGKCVECLTNSECAPKICFQGICDSCKKNPSECGSLTCATNGDCVITPPPPPPTEAPEFQPFPVYNWFNALISIFMLIIYYLRKSFKLI